MSGRDLGKVFVTGSDGFIGSHLVETLVKRGVEVTALCLYNSNSSYGWLEELSNRKPANLKLLLGDVRDSGFMENAIKGHNTVFHLASLIAIPYSYLAPQSYVDTNASGSLNVMQACLKANVERVIHTSTSEVYGTAKFVPITESHPLQGQSPYSASKIAADMIVNSFYCSFSLPVVTLRPFNTFGPRQSFRAVIPTIIGQILSGMTEIKLGNITPTRDFNFVTNTVDAFLSVAEAKADGLLGNVFNAGSGVEITIKDLVLLIGKLIGKDVTVLEDGARVRPNFSEVERLLADYSRLSAATDWKPKVDLENGLIKTIEWQKGNPFLGKSSSYQV